MSVPPRPWPRPLGPPDAEARARASDLGQSLQDASLAGRAASRWSRLLECPVGATPLADSGARPHGHPRATAGFRWPDGRALQLAVDCHLVAGVLRRLAGLPALEVGPLPLTAAEEGLFAYLALALVACLDEPRPHLEWVHGGEPAWRVAPAPVGRVSWRLELGEHAGRATWSFDAGGTAASAPDAAAVPLRLRLLAPAARVAATPLRAGDLLPLEGAHLSLRGAGGLRVDVERTPSGLRTLAPPFVSEVHMSTSSLEALPCSLEVRLGELVLTAGQVAALRPGAVLPLPLPDPPLVRLCVGEQVVAIGILVDDGGQLAVQLTRVSAHVPP